MSFSFISWGPSQKFHDLGNFCKMFSHQSIVYLCTGNFTVFYKELDAFLEENGKAADKRRSSQVAHLPFTVSVNHLIKKVNVEK